MDAIKVKNITKIFKGFVAVDNVSFKVPGGKTFGLLGSNGAGKTTMINMLTGLLIPTPGEINVLGIDALKKIEKVRKRIALVPQETSLYQNLTVYENLEFFGGLYLSNRELKAEIVKMISALDLNEKRNSFVSELSGGYKRRCFIACALISQPKILILDEPITGIDLNTREIIMNLIMSFKDMTVVLTTHSIKEAQAVCDHIVFLNAGKKILEGNPKEIINHYSRKLGEAVSIDFSININVRKIKNYLEKSKFEIENLEVNSRNISFTTKKSGKSIIKVMTALHSLNSYVLNVEIRKQELEGILKHIIEKENASSKNHKKENNLDL